MRSWVALILAVGVDARAAEPGLFPLGGPVLDRMCAAPIVVLGTITKARSYRVDLRAGDGGRVQVLYTDLELAVSDTLKGEARATWSLTVPGGRIGELTIGTPETLRAVVGDRHVVALVLLAEDAGAYAKGKPLVTASVRIEPDAEIPGRDALVVQFAEGRRRTAEFIDACRR